ncbi:MAG: LptA/OstA family protein [Candidatus Omnitrophica bacterium]|nr:LptA/OstA family protein [Candidatus Omnitrophota bacterium]
MVYISMKIAVIILAVVMSFAITGASGAETAPKNTEASGIGGDSVKHKILSFNLEGVTEKGEKKWDVTGEAAEAITSDKIKLDNIVARAYGDEASATITADKGVYNKALNNVQLEQNVKATIENKVDATGDISMFGASSPIDKAKAFGGEKAKKRKTVITCDGEVQFDYEKNQAYFSKNVKVVNDEGTIDADKITIYMDTSTKKLKEIVADGNVKITRGENTTYSEKATYIDAEKRILLTGRPRLVIYQEGGLEENIMRKK